MSSLLSAEECKLPIEQIEALLRARNAPPDTVLYQAHYDPSFLTSSTISVLLSQEINWIKLCIWSSPWDVDLTVKNNLTLERNDWANTISGMMSQGQRWIEDETSIPRNLAFYFEAKLRKLEAFELTSGRRGITLDGMLIGGAMLILNQRKHNFDAHSPTGEHWQYANYLHNLALRCLEEKRSLKYLIALMMWF